MYSEFSVVPFHKVSQCQWGEFAALGSKEWRGRILLW
jgi:hypothetical protein